MALDHIPFDQITDVDLQKLIDGGVSENRFIDYKRDAIGGSNDDKKEFLKDVSSFANANGGYMVLGLEEKASLPVMLVGISVPDMGKEVQRLENLVRNSIELRLNVQMRAIPQSGGKGMWAGVE